LGFTFTAIFFIIAVRRMPPPAMRSNGRHNTPPMAEAGPGLPLSLSRALRARAAAYGRWLGRCRSRAAAEDVRRLRTTLRRLLSLLDAAQSVAPRRSLPRIRRRLRAQLRSLGPLRDIDIARASLDAAGQANPSLDLYTAWLAARRPKLAAAARRDLSALDPAPLLAALRYFADNLAGVPPQACVRGVRLFLAAALAKAIKAWERTAPGDFRASHRLRITCKRLRYAAEWLGPSLPGFSPHDLDAMHRLHSLAGKIQDMGVTAAGLAGFGAARNATVLAELRPVLASLDAERSSLISGLGPAAARALEYWMKRSAAGQLPQTRRGVSS